MSDSSSVVRARQERLAEMTRKGRIVCGFGMHLSYDDHDRAVWELPYNPALDHAGGDIHGGVIATLIDNAGWFTAAPHYDSWIATVEFQTRLLERARATDLRAVGFVVRLGKRLATTTMEVRAADDRLIATGSGTFAVTSVPLPT